MIRAVLPHADGLAARLAGHAAVSARARAERRLREGRADPLRWRMAHLLWPLFNQER